ncbi:unnamed protein product [Acanthoscelides obtectus]|uniref:Uncharacterized protein n=1 Tax=Acanthoscelides obtectus TaxID=200917 RepID=A0A9P0KRE0_ACAOB|nr:unnamed protein product [Acanthoscelides obtectus]CAK1675101.1 hypothetical protein AOBTE_LOCUS29903 [Acanthoscelides obtectus]
MRASEIKWLKTNERRTLHFSSFLLKIINTPGSPDSIRKRLIFRHSVHDINVRYLKKLTMPLHSSALF